MGKIAVEVNEGEGKKLYKLRRRGWKQTGKEEAD